MRNIIKRLLLILLSFNVFAQERQFDANIAVAANFKNAITTINEKFNQQNDCKINFVIASTGQLRTQIIQDAPFDALFAADAKSFKMIADEKVNKVIENSNFIYAKGTLAIIANKNLDEEILSLIEKGEIVEALQKYNDFVVIANPELAPYGKIAFDFLNENNLYKEAKTVQSANINAALNAVLSENAEIGFIAFSDYKNIDKDKFIVLPFPENLAPTINQEAFLINLDDKQQTVNACAKDFLDFTQQNGEAREIIKDFGYILNPA